MGVKVVIARLRPNKDDDIRKALSILPAYYDESDIIREALRQFLFSHKGRVPQLLGSQVYTEANDLNDDRENAELKRAEIVDAEDLDATLDKFILE